MKKLNLRETQECLFDVLIFADRIFKKNNIDYSLAYGTLLGAARHKGFIPWDDDLDIVMPFSDYKKMLTLPELNQPNSKYTVHYSKTTKLNNEKRYNFPFAKIENNCTKCVFNASNEGGGAFLDVFPMTPLPLNNQTKYANRLMKLQRYLGYTYVKYDDPVKNFAQKFVSPCYKILRDEIEREAFKFTIGNQKYDKLASATWDDKILSRAVPKEWFDNYVELDFEGEKFKAISNYKEWLTLVYGDWRQLPPKEKQVAHHFFDLYVK